MSFVKNSSDSDYKKFFSKKYFEKKLEKSMAQKLMRIIRNKEIFPYCGSIAIKLENDSQ
jgi:hypothetical protein